MLAFTFNSSTNSTDFIADLKNTALRGGACFQTILMDPALNVLYCLLRRRSIRE